MSLTVAQLIEKLKECPPDGTVYWWDPGFPRVGHVEAWGGRVYLIERRPTDAPPRCRYCGEDCSNGRSWDGDDLYACSRCADERARLRGRGKPKNAEQRADIARIVARHWRDAALRSGEQWFPGRAAAHPLSLVLDALDGEADPVGLGIPVGREADEIREVAARHYCRNCGGGIDPDHPHVHAGFGACFVM